MVENFLLSVKICTCQSHCKKKKIILICMNENKKVWFKLHFLCKTFDIFQVKPHVTEHFVGVQHLLMTAECDVFGKIQQFW